MFRDAQTQTGGRQNLFLSAAVLITVMLRKKINVYFVLVMFLSVLAERSVKIAFCQFVFW